MNRTVREVISAGAGLAGFAATLGLTSSVLIAAPVPFLIYAGCRLFLPVQDANPALAGDVVTDPELRDFLQRVRQPRDEIEKMIPDLPSHLQEVVREITRVIDDICASFKSEPQDIRQARPFPDRVGALEDMLTNFVRLQKYQDRSSKAREAVTNLEQALPRNLELFKAVHGRLLDKDASKLSVDTRTLEQLMKLD